MNINDIKHIYFVGIGGIGMSALARYCLERKLNVYGYDKTQTQLSKQLEDEGAIITYIDEPTEIPDPFDFPDSTKLVVYTPAIPKNNLILTAFQKKGFSVIKRAQLLGEISSNHFTVAVAGTHGKTTTSCLIAHLLNHSTYQFTAILGGISADLQSNYYHKKEGEHYQSRSILVTEADEFDQSFLHLNPNLAVITSTDADHLDVYGEDEAVRLSYQKFANLVSNNVIISDSAIIDSKIGLTYGAKGDFSYHNINIEEGKQSFSLKTPSYLIEDITANLPGEHNISNATAAAAIGYLLNIPELVIKKSISTYQGVQRRFEYLVNNEHGTVIDDYAHHPKELNVLLNSLKRLYPSKKICMIFQPHLYSRTRDFMSEFAEQLSLADEVILMPIYPARELPINGVSSSILLDQIDNEKKQLLNHQEVIDYIRNTQPELLVLTGAGDINLLRNPIKNIYIVKE